MHQSLYCWRLLHEGDLRRCYRNSGSVTYVSTLPSPSSSAPCISSFVQCPGTLEANVREWHFVQHSLLISFPLPGGLFQWGLIGDKKGVGFLREAGGGDMEGGGKLLDVEKYGVCGCYQAIRLVGIGAVYLRDAKECGIDNPIICL